MTFGYYLEGVSGGTPIRHCLEGYKSQQGAERAAARYRERFKVAETGHVVFSFSGGERKYDRRSYAVLSRFNAKAFFEFWH